MSLFDKLFRPKKYQADQFFSTLASYTPVFHRWRGELYESELVRAAIDATARHVSKLQVKNSTEAYRIAKELGLV